MALYDAIRSPSFSCKHITGITSIPGICPARSKARLPFLSRNSWVRGIGPKWVRMSKTSPRSVGSRSVGFFCLIGKIYKYALVLPWFPKSQKEDVSWKKRSFWKHLRKFRVGKRILKLSSDQVPSAVKAFQRSSAQGRKFAHTRPQHST